MFDKLVVTIMGEYATHSFQRLVGLDDDQGVFQQKYFCNSSINALLKRESEKKAESKRSKQCL